MQKEKVYNLSEILAETQQKPAVAEPEIRKEEEPKEAKDPKADWIVMNGKRRPHP
jgi:hypothetical protein